LSTLGVGLSSFIVAPESIPPAPAATDTAVQYQRGPGRKQAKLEPLATMGTEASWPAGPLLNRTGLEINRCQDYANYWLILGFDRDGR
jgi:hypothetical protein